MVSYRWTTMANAELVRYAQSENKPLIVHPQAEAEVKGLYADFYGKLLGE